MTFSRPITTNMPEKERFTLYFESLIKAMEARYDWISVDDASLDGRSYRFRPKRYTGKLWNIQRGECCYRAWFPSDKWFPSVNTEVVAGLHIRESQALLNALRELKAEIETDFGDTLDWSQKLCRSPRQKRKFVFASRRGSIQSSERRVAGNW